MTNPSQEPVVARIGVRLLGTIGLIGWLSALAALIFFQAELYRYLPFEWLGESTVDRSLPGKWLAFAAFCAWVASGPGLMLSCLLFMPRTHRRSDWVWTALTASYLVLPFLTLMFAGGIR